MVGHGNYSSFISSQQLRSAHRDIVAERRRKRARAPTLTADDHSSLHGRRADMIPAHDAAHASSMTELIARKRRYAARLATSILSNMPPMAFDRHIDFM